MIRKISKNLSYEISIVIQIFKVNLEMEHMIYITYFAFKYLKRQLSPEAKKASFIFLSAIVSILLLIILLWWSLFDSPILKNNINESVSMYICFYTDSCIRNRIRCSSKSYVLKSFLFYVFFPKSFILSQGSQVRTYILTFT